MMQECCYGKLLQILSLFQTDDKHYMHVRLRLGLEKIDFDLNLDEFTYKNLQKIVGSYDAYYRISFKTYWDDYKEQYFSFLSIVKQGKSFKVCFPCTELFVSNINWLKSLNSLTQLETILIPGVENNGRVNCFRRGLMINYVRHILLRLLLIIGLSIFVVGYMGSVEVYCPVFDDNFVSKDLSGAYNYMHGAARDLETGIRLEDENLSAELFVLSSVSEEKVMGINEIFNAKLPEPLAAPKLKSLMCEVEDNTRQLPYYMVSEGNGIIYSLSTGYAALTFDDGPSRHTLMIVDILRKYNVGATFFFVGENVDANPEIVKYVYDSGFSIGNHSYSHPMFVGLSSYEQATEIEKTNRSIKNLTGEVVTLFRPPYGGLDDNTSTVLSTMNMKTVLWNRDPEDWNGADNDAIFQYVVDTNPYGGIYLFHETAKTVKALPKIIEFLLQQDLNIVSLK